MLSKVFILSPVVFGEKHLLGTGILFVLSFFFLLWIRMKKSSLTKHDRLFLHTFTLLFLIIEGLRLYFLYTKNDSFSIIQLPLNLCSVPLYVYPLLSLSKKESWLHRFVLPASFATVMLAGLIALVLPTNILGDELHWVPLDKNYVEIASFTYHALMMTAPLALIALGYYQPRLKHVGNALLFTGLFAAVAMTFNAFNGTDFLLLNTGNGSPFQFLIEAESRLVYQIVMIGLGSFLISVFFLLSEIIYQSKKRFHIKSVTSY